MIKFPRVIKNNNAFINGESYAGLSDVAKLPNLNLQKAKHRAAGMDGAATLDMGTEDMTAEVSLKEWAPPALKLIGTRKRMVLRPAAQGKLHDDVRTIIVTLGGLWGGIDFGELKPGSDAPVKLSLEVDYYRLEIDGEEIWDIDLIAGKRVIGGVDQLAALRAAMGMQ